MLTLAQLALVAYLFQVAAIDHWHPDPAHDIWGVEGTQQHEVHCHIDAGSCADASAGFAVMNGAEIIALPGPSFAPAAMLVSERQSPGDVFIPTLSNPPQAT